MKKEKSFTIIDISLGIDKPRACAKLIGIKIDPNATWLDLLIQEIFDSYCQWKDKRDEAKVPAVRFVKFKRLLWKILGDTGLVK